MNSSEATHGLISLLQAARTVLFVLILPLHEQTSILRQALWLKVAETCQSFGYAGHPAKRLMGPGKTDLSTKSISAGSGGTRDSSAE